MLLFFLITFCFKHSPELIIIKIGNNMNLANILTLTRFIIAPLFIISFSFHTLSSYIICFILAGLIELSDLFDGKIARRNQQISDFGKLMDPFADSLSRFTIFLCFLSARLAPVWIIAIFFYRDVLVSVIRVFSMRQGVVVAARKSGKVKAWAQATSILLILAALIFKDLGLLKNVLSSEEQFYHFSFGILAISSFVTFLSAIDYWKANKASVIMALENK